ncbi:MAG: elongation factor Ts [Clostridia bacterium]|nr:elongation factor Ts [Clostridia bacterium]
MAVTASQVMELRKKTGAGMMECKKVLTETDGDEEKAIDLLKERGILKAQKKSDRIAAEGLVETYISEDGKIGAIVEVNSETDFVAKNEEFQKFVADVVKQVALNNPKDVDELLSQESISESGKTVNDVLTSKIATIGENLSVRRIERYETDGMLSSYIHGNGKIGVLLDMKADDAELGKDICMQIAAAKPEFVNESDVPADRLEKEKEILKAQVVNEGKPEAIAEKIVMGRLGKFYGQICLVDQEFVKDSSMKVKDLLKSKNAEVVRFARFERGEGIEKKEENFAEEVAKQLQ